MVFEQTPQGIVLRVRLTPNSSCCKINGIFAGAEGTEWLKISVVSVAEKGRANQELIKFLAAEFKIAKSAMTIVSGELDRYKKFLITADEARIKARLEEV